MHNSLVCWNSKGFQNQQCCRTSTPQLYHHSGHDDAGHRGRRGISCMLHASCTHGWCMEVRCLSSHRSPLAAASLQARQHPAASPQATPRRSRRPRTRAGSSHGCPCRRLWRACACSCRCHHTPSHGTGTGCSPPQWTPERQHIGFRDWNVDYQPAKPDLGLVGQPGDCHQRMS